MYVVQNVEFEIRIIGVFDTLEQATQVVDEYPGILELSKYELNSKNDDGCVVHAKEKDCK